MNMIKKVITCEHVNSHLDVLNNMMAYVAE